MLENAVRSTTRFVVKHRGVIAVVATTVVCVAISKYARSQTDEFLKEHDLYEAYYTPDAD